MRDAPHRGRGAGAGGRRPPAPAAGLLARHVAGTVQMAETRGPLAPSADPLTREERCARATSRSSRLGPASARQRPKAAYAGASGRRCAPGVRVPRPGRVHRSRRPDKRRHPLASSRSVPLGGAQTSTVLAGGVRGRAGRGRSRRLVLGALGPGNPVRSWRTEVGADGPSHRVDHVPFLGHPAPTLLQLLRREALQRGLALAPVGPYGRLLDVQHGGDIEAFHGDAVLLG